MRRSRAAGAGQRRHGDAGPGVGGPGRAGFARAGIPYGDGFVKNRYVGRTFIQPTQKKRGTDVRLKLNPLRDNIKGKRLIVVDDSIVRGTTTRQIIALLREAGATEVHFRVSSPPYRWPCFYGLDTGKRSDLLAADMEIGEIALYLGVDSLAYLDLDHLVAATGAEGIVLHRVLHRRVSGSRSRVRHQARARGRVAHDPRAGNDLRLRTCRARVSPADRRLTYSGAGVDIAAGEKAVELIKAHVRSTFRPEVVGDIGGFGGLFAVDWKRFRDPLLVSSTDGVGTKSLVARLADRRNTIGIDCVAMSVDDIAPRAPNRCSSSTTSRSASSSPKRSRRWSRAWPKAAASALRAARRRDVGAPGRDGAGRVRSRGVRGRRGRAQ